MGAYLCRKCSIPYREYKYSQLPWVSSCFIHSYNGRINRKYSSYNHNKKICNDCLWNNRKCHHVWKFKFFKQKKII